MGNSANLVMKVRCRDCAQAFAVPFQMPPSAYDSPNRTANDYRCPHCRCEAEYDEEDHFFSR